jgi:hypothetical protein
MSFHCVGDTGGVKNPEPQKLVERGLEQSLHIGNLAPSLRGALMASSFCYHHVSVIARSVVARRALSWQGIAASLRSSQ